MARPRRSTAGGGGAATTSPAQRRHHAVQKHAAIASPPPSASHKTKPKIEKRPSPFPSSPINNKFYSARGVLGERRFRGKTEYRVDWADGPKGQVYAATWEPRSYLTDDLFKHWQAMKRENKSALIANVANINPEVAGGEVVDDESDGDKEQHASEVARIEVDGDEEIRGYEIAGVELERGGLDSAVSGSRSTLVPAQTASNVASIVEPIIVSIDPANYNQATPSRGHANAGAVVDAASTIERTRSMILRIDAVALTAERTASTLDDVRRMTERVEADIQLDNATATPPVIRSIASPTPEPLPRGLTADLHDLWQDVVDVTDDEVVDLTRESSPPPMVPAVSLPLSSPPVMSAVRATKRKRPIDQECGICTDELEKADLIITQACCDVDYCADCIQKWFLADKKHTCPNCRQPRNGNWVPFHRTVD